MVCQISAAALAQGGCGDTAAQQQGPTADGADPIKGIAPGTWAPNHEGGRQDLVGHGIQGL